MAVFINGVISPANLLDEMLGGESGPSTSLVDVIGQVRAQEGDGPLTVYINSPGGEVEEGFAIHDYLQSLGREVLTIATGQCSSIATVVFLAGSVRQVQCSLMIHNPWVGAEGDAQGMREAVAVLEETEKRIEKFYAGKLDIDAQTISALMQAETYITPEQALALGFATYEVTTPAMAMLRPATDNPSKPITNQNQNLENMTETILKKALKALGFGVKGETLCLELTTADGSTLTVEREDGAPQVGDTASPDGEHAMPDGTTIVVSGGVITEIREVDAEGDDPTAPTPEEELAQARTRITELENQLAVVNAALPTQDDQRALNAVKALGGVQALAKMCSTYTPAARTNPRIAQAEREPGYKTQLNAIKNKK